MASWAGAQCCPGGRTYGEAFAEGGLAALKILLPLLPGLDPERLNNIQEALDRALAGHAYAKGAVIQGCLDITARRANTPVATLFGGWTAETCGYPCSLQAMPVENALARIRAKRAEGFRNFILHGSGDVVTDPELARAVL